MDTFLDTYRCDVAHRTRRTHVIYGVVQHAREHPRSSGPPVQPFEQHPTAAHLQAQQEWGDSYFSLGGPTSPPRSGQPRHTHCPRAARLTPRERHKAVEVNPAAAIDYLGLVAGSYACEQRVDWPNVIGLGDDQPLA